MAKPKGKAIVGWTNSSSFDAANVEVLAEWDVNQAKNRKAGRGPTFSSGHFVRQIGLARRKNGGWGSTPPSTTYHIYTHSQVSNGSSYLYRPPAFVGLTREDLSRLWMEIGKELFGEKE